jgi:hypothetical protein
MTGWVIALAIPHRFDGAKAFDLEAGLELRVRERRRRPAMSFSLQIADGRCTVVRGPARDPAASAALGLGDLIRLALGLVGWPELMSSGRLELSGDPFLALRFPTLFRLPVQARQARRLQ